MDNKRLGKGFVWGVIATLAMSVIMMIGQLTGLAPMPAPIPAAIVKHIIGEAPKPLLMILAIMAHLGYGGTFGAVLAGITQPVTVKKGILLGVILWFIMQIIVLPFLGWGFFGVAITPKIAVATLILHLIYGFTLGWGLDRENKRQAT